jgi:hypothetical protein
MSAMFARLSREERVLLLTSPTDAHKIPRWRVRTVGAEVAHSDAAPSSDLLDHVDHQWRAAKASQKVDLTTGTICRLLSTRAQVKRVGLMLPPISRKELLERQRQKLLPSTLVAWGDEAPLSGDAEASAEAIDRCLLTLDWFAASDLMVRLLCPGADQHPLPYTTPFELGRRFAETYAPLLCATSSQFHFFATVVWILLEATAQQHATQSMAQLMSVTSAPLILPQLRNLHPLVVEGFYIAQKEWLSYRAKGISSLAPCGVPAVILTVDRTFLTSGGTSEEVLVPTPTSWSQSTVCSQDRSSLVQLATTIEHLFMQYNAVMLVCPLRVLREVSRALTDAPKSTPQRKSRRSDVRNGTGGQSMRELHDIVRESTCLPDAPPLLLLDREASQRPVASITALDVADAVSYLGAGMLGGGPAAPKVIELSKGHRVLLERWLSLRCMSIAAKANQRGAGMSWYLQRLIRPSMIKGGGQCGSPRVLLTIQHADGSKTELGDPREISGTSLLSKQSGGSRRASRPEDLLEGVAWNQVTMSCLDNFITAAIEYGHLLGRTQTPLALGASQAPQYPKQQPMLRLMGHQLLVPVHSAVLQFVLQCHPDARYISGCGVRSMYVNGEGKLVVERACYMFCVWDYRLSFASSRNMRGDEPMHRVAAGASLLREPRELKRQDRPLPLPRGVPYALVIKANVMGMLAHYREELRKRTIDAPGAVADGRMYLHDDESSAVKYILSHHPRYFARRGCGVKTIFVTLEDRSATFCAPHEVGGICHVLRYCESTVPFNVCECYGEADELCGPEVLVDAVVQDGQRKRERDR